jgi:hypothetical protein
MNQFQQNQGFQGRFPVCMPEVSDAPAPPKLVELFMYPCIPPERYICFYWTVLNKNEGPQLIWFDGVLWHYADEKAWNEYVNHWLVSSYFNNHHLGGMGRNGLNVSQDCLLFDTENGQMHVAPVARAVALARRCAADTLRMLPSGMEGAYLRAARTAVCAPARFSANRVLEGQEERVHTIRNWLEVNGVPF